ncbi:MAG TPA: S8 family peptidase, partial [Nitrospira sp.]|nr:S8 family peptidase [Nitrospira sp.]
MGVSDFGTEITPESVADSLVARAAPAIEAPPASIESLESVDVDVLTQMDPRLQRAVVRARQGIVKLPGASTETDEVAVVATVTDPDAWESLSEVRMGAVIGTDESGETMVTGRIPVRRVEAVRHQPFVTSLKASQRLQPSLDRTIAEIGARGDLLPNGNQGDGGRGAIVGIIDFGCDFAHENFRNADGTTRLLAIWDQRGPSSPSSPFGFGKVHTRNDINAALNQPNPYAALGYGPPPDNAFQQGSHGTHVMDIAAGNGRGSGISGVAPNADIIFVEAAANDIPFSGPNAVGKSFGDSVQLLEAVKFIFEQAGNRPCVINASLGTNGGPHDGTTLVENGIDRLLRQAPNRAMVIAASNSFSDGIHATGRVTPGGTVDLVWNVPSQDSSSNELEIWYDGADRFGVDVIAPNGETVISVEPDQTRALNSNGRVVLLAANRLADPNNQDNMIGIFLEAGLPLGRWTIRLRGLTVQDGSFHAWIERDDAGQSSFPEPLDNSHTIGSISCGRETIVVGSYDAHKPTLPLSFFSSAGPTRDGREKPEVSGPGHAVFAAHSRTRTGTIRKSGTSMASPAVAGVVALLLSEASARGQSMTSAQIRNSVITTARRTPPPGAQWDPRFGFGRVSAHDAVSGVITASPVTSISSNGGSNGANNG